MKLSWIFVILLLVIVAIFSVQNADAVTVRFLRWEVTMSAALVIQIAALLGGVVGLVVGALSRRPARKERTESVRGGPGEPGNASSPGPAVRPPGSFAASEGEDFRPRN